MSLSSTRDPFFAQHSQLLNEDHTTSINANLLAFSFDLKEWKRRLWRNSMCRDCGHGPFHQPSSWTPIVDITFFSFFFYVNLSCVVIANKILVMSISELILTLLLEKDNWETFHDSSFHAMCDFSTCVHFMMLFLKKFAATKQILHVYERNIDPLFGNLM